jgi:hypothetical protein
VANAGLDLVGLIPGENLAVTSAKITATGVLATEEVLTSNASSGALTATGFGLDIAKKEIHENAANVSKGLAETVPILGELVVGVSVIKDGYDAYQEYKDCESRRSGK